MRMPDKIICAGDDDCGLTGRKSLHDQFPALIPCINSLRLVIEYLAAKACQRQRGRGQDTNVWYKNVI